MITYLSPIGSGYQAFDNQGLPLTGGKLYSYVADTNTPQATYSDVDGLVQNLNPIILDSSGRVPVEIRFAEGVKYKLSLTDPNDVHIWDLDNLAGINDIPASGTTEIPFWVNFGVTPVRLSDNSFSISGNWGVLLVDERRIELVQGGGAIYGSVTSCVVSEVTPGAFISTVTLRLDSGTILSDVSEGFYSIIDPEANPMPSDYALQIQVAELAVDVASLSDQVTTLTTLVANATPVGTIIAWPNTIPPSGWQECNGAYFDVTDEPDLFSVLGYQFGGSGANFAVPDLRGDFIRGWDNSRGLDVARNFATVQTSQVQYHKHVAPFTERWGGDPFGHSSNQGHYGSHGGSDNDNFWGYTNNGYNETGCADLNAAGVVGTETRPHNTALLYIIRMRNS